MEQPPDERSLDQIRAEILTRTSALRCSVLDVRNRAAGKDAHEVGRAGRALSNALRTHRLAELTPLGDVIDRMATFEDTLIRSQPERAPDLAAALELGIGIFERALEARLDGAATSRLESLAEALRGAFPDPWRSYAAPADTELDVEDPDGLAVERVGPAVEESELLQDELITAFISEAKAIFDRCEEIAFAFEESGDVDALADGISAQFGLLGASAAALELDEVAAQLERGADLLEEARRGSIALEPERLTDFLVRLTDSVKGLIDEACGLEHTALPIIEDLDDEIARLASAPPTTAMRRRMGRA